MSTSCTLLLKVITLIVFGNIFLYFIEGPSCCTMTFSNFLQNIFCGFFGLHLWNMIFYSGTISYTTLLDNDPMYTLVALLLVEICTLVITQY